MATERLLWRVPECAEAIGMSRAKCYELVASGEIPSVQIGGVRRVPVDALRERIARRLAEQTGPEAA